MNYFDTFWDNIFAYLQDGNYSIDINTAECAVHPLTTLRNSISRSGSDEGGGNCSYLLYCKDTRTGCL
ncbi:transposase [Bacteroides nordii]|uniref:IS66 family transposase n=1 Tax=Bacteroides nordii TaxID=291645 RepID=UPI001CC0AB69|nr:transposase [Bacteroides nordii]